MRDDDDSLGVIGELRSIPRSPVVWNEMRAIDDSDPDAVDRLARVICRDPILAGEFAEAARGGRVGAVGPADVQRALLARGIPASRCLVLSILVKHDLLEWKRPGSELDRPTWWRHSLGTALAAVRMSELVPSGSPLSCYAAGLMHDVGILAVDHYAPQVLGHVVRNPGDAGDDAEDAATGTRILGVSHPELGRIVAENWNLPEHAPDAVFRHHRPTSAEPGCRTLACVVCVADVLMSPAWAWWCCGGPEEEYRNALAHLRLDEYTLRNIREGVELDLRRLGSVLRPPTRH